MKREYLRNGILWKDIPNAYNLAGSICPDDTKFTYLHAAQLIKHILGLKAGFGKDGFRLLYLWFDVFGEEGSTHRNDIEAFSQVLRSDGIKFHAMTYQELIIKLSNEYRREHSQYVKYMTERYL